MGAGGAPGEVLGVREPRQSRTRIQWARVLDSGLALLEDEGYDGFTISALCDRAGVPPRALYARADTKDALFLAVYEHGMSRVVAAEAVLDDASRWVGLTMPERIDQVVDVLLAIFRDHQRFLRAVILVSGAHPEVLRRGRLYRARLQQRFLTALDGHSGHPLPSPADWTFSFDVLFATLTMHTAYVGLDPDDDHDHDHHHEPSPDRLKLMARRFLQV